VSRSATAPVAGGLRFAARRCLYDSEWIMQALHFRIGALLLICGVSCLACSDDETSASGQGGATSSATGGTGGSATGGAGGSSTTGCSLLDGTSCADFLDGCYAPDTSGTCTDSGTELSWSDGHKIVRLGGEPGLYGPSDASPCITLTFDGNTNTSTLTNVATSDVLLNQDLGDGNILITCPGGDEHTFTAAELEDDNVCKGISCGS
jgi:hypothetical protein